MEIVDQKVSLSKLKPLAQNSFGDLVKAVVDIEKEIMVIGASLHSDEESLLISEGSKQENLWGINLYPEQYDTNFIEFDSVINLRPSFGNRTRSVDDPKIQTKIINIIHRLVIK